MSVRFRICLMAWIVVLAMTILNQHASAQTTELTPIPDEVLPAPAPVIDPLPIESEDNWQISIQPSQKVTYAAVAGQTGDCKACDALAKAAAYQKIYNSIPFNRAEYNVNPGYRHDATMEILTGNARHKTIVVHDDREQPVSLVPRQPVVHPLNPSRYGYLRPSLRLNYYRYFPSLNPYVNIWNYSGAF